jgi:hypothetical protein
MAPRGGVAALRPTQDIELLRGLAGIDICNDDGTHGLALSPTLLGLSLFCCDDRISPAQTGKQLLQYARPC